jgi:hypothetical protein
LSTAEKPISGHDPAGKGRDIRNEPRIPDHPRGLKRSDKGIAGGIDVRVEAV